MANSDIAIGTLALHRNKMKEACPLKVRDYLACGIPTIIGYEDTDFPYSVPFLLQIPNTEDNVKESVKIIEEFVYRWKGKRVQRNEIIHIDNSYKESERLKFFEQVLRG